MYKYLVEDCSALCYSNGHTLKGLRANEIETGVIYGFLNQILYFSEQFKTNKFVFCWDSKSTKREELFPEYKIKRKEKKKNGTEAEKAFYQSLGRQIGKLKEDILPYIGFKNSFYQDGYEADDVIADIVIGYDGCLMITGDEDMFQLLEYADMYKPKVEEIWTKEKFYKHYGIKSNEWVTVKSIGGCTSDEIPGVSGVKEITAIKYLLGTLKSSSKAYQSIVNGKKIIERNKKLVKLPFEGTKEFEIVADSFNLENLLEVAKEYWINSYLTKVGTARWENFFKRKPIW